MGWSNKTHEGLQFAAITCLFTLIDVFISFSTAGVVMLQLLAAGANRYATLALAILIGVGCMLYLRFNHKIRNFTTSGS